VKEVPVAEIIMLPVAKPPRVRKGETPSPKPARWKRNPLRVVSDFALLSATTANPHGPAPCCPVVFCIETVVGCLEDEELDHVHTVVSRFRDACATEMGRREAHGVPPRRRKSSKRRVLA
jgi:hypothetical protein